MCIFQGLLRLKEPSVLLRCRKEDVHMVQSVLQAAKAEYAKRTHVHEPEIIVDSIYLPPSPSHHDPHALSWYIFILKIIFCLIYFFPLCLHAGCTFVL